MCVSKKEKEEEQRTTPSPDPEPPSGRKQRVEREGGPSLHPDGVEESPKPQRPRREMRKSPQQPPAETKDGEAVDMEIDVKESRHN